MCLFFAFSLPGGLVWGRFKVKDFAIKEVVPYAICLSWEGEAAGGGGDSMATGGEKNPGIVDLAKHKLFIEGATGVDKNPGVVDLA